MVDLVSHSLPLPLIYYAPISQGGLADYARHQATALAAEGAEVFLVCSEDFPQAAGPYKICPILRSFVPRGTLSKWRRPLHYLETVCANSYMLAQHIDQLAVRHVLFNAYSEYLAPLWARPLRRLRQQGVTFGAVVHDPVRDFQVGPRWWHRWSIAEAYSFLDVAFVHAPITLDTGRPMPHLRTVVVPHGLYQFPPATQSRKQVRDRLQIPSDAPLLLSFGFIRDNKNLDLVIQAMAHLPEVYLLVAGQEQSSQHKPASYYQSLAETWGVSDRIRWHLNFIPDTEVAAFFLTADLILLTYSTSFRSASGVFNTAATFRKPCLASSGESNLKSVVEQYEMGLWIEPDSVDAIQQGLQTWMQGLLPRPQWDQYLSHYSWQRNAELVLQAMA